MEFQPYVIYGFFRFGGTDVFSVVCVFLDSRLLVVFVFCLVSFPVWARPLHRNRLSSRYPLLVHQELGRLAVRVFLFELWHPCALFCSHARKKSVQRGLFARDCHVLLWNPFRVFCQRFHRHSIPLRRKGPVLDVFYVFAFCRFWHEIDSFYTIK